MALKETDSISSSFPEESKLECSQCLSLQRAYRANSASTNAVSAAIHCTTLQARFPDDENHFEVTKAYLEHHSMPIERLWPRKREIEPLTQKESADHLSHLQDFEDVGLFLVN